MNAPTAHSISIRPAFPDDGAALLRLAQLDSARVPVAPLLVAEVDGELQAARSLADGSVIADPFSPTERLVVLLEVHATQRAHPGLARRRSALSAAAAVARALAVRRDRPEPLRHPTADARDLIAHIPGALVRTP